MKRHEITVKLNQEDYRKLKERSSQKGISYTDFFLSHFYTLDYESDKKYNILQYVKKNIQIITDEMRSLDQQEYLFSLDNNLDRIESIIDILREKNNER